MAFSWQTHGKLMAFFPQNHEIMAFFSKIRQPLAALGLPNSPWQDRRAVTAFEDGASRSLNVLKF